jgi:hypothetical protein
VQIRAKVSAGRHTTAIWFQADRHRQKPPVPSATSKGAEIIGRRNGISQRGRRTNTD